MDNKINPFAVDDVPIEASLAALYEWVLTYGYNFVSTDKLLDTNLDHYLIWHQCSCLGIIRHGNTASGSGYYLTPKIHEILKEYSNEY